MSRAAGSSRARGLSASKTQANTPVALARKYSDEGADELVFLDITASDERRKTIKNLVMSVASVIDIPFTVGGGVATLDDARNILLSAEGPTRLESTRAR